MIIAPPPFDEAARLQRLHDLNVLDSAPEPRFDALTSRALRAFPGASIALISLIDRDRQWFKSAIGLDATETPREFSFCAHALLGSRVMVVPDATKDRRFTGNPFVKGEPGIRFYAGAPLVGGVGVLCVIGTEPRHASKAEVDRLSELAHLVGTQLLMFGALSALAGEPASTFGLVGKDIGSLVAESV